MAPKNKKSNQKKNSAFGQYGERRLGNQPPMHQPTISIKHVARFNFVAAVNAGTIITYNDLSDIFNIATSATTAVKLFNDVIRVKRVSMWGAPNSSGTPSTVQVEFAGLSLGAAGPNKRISDTMIGTARGPVVHARPTGAASQWIPAGSNSTAFEVFASVGGGVVEVEMEGVTSASAEVISTQVAPVAATTGALYQRGLDGVALAGSNFTSIGFVQD
jgi:hypothetical protein